MKQFNVYVNKDGKLVGHYNRVNKKCFGHTTRWFYKYDKMKIKYYECLMDNYVDEYNRTNDDWYKHQYESAYNNYRKCLKELNELIERRNYHEINY